MKASSTQLQRRGHDRADEIRELHADIGLLYAASLQKAFRIGELLSEQKAECRHGEWLPWLEANFSGVISSQTAQQYMRMHENRELLIGHAVETYSDARRLLAEHSKKGNRHQAAKKATKTTEARQQAARERRIEDLVTKCNLSHAAAERVVVFEERERRRRSKVRQAMREAREELEDRLRRQGKLEVPVNTRLNARTLRKLEKKAAAKGMTVPEYLTWLAEREASK